jgi:ketosteroid isomerase-like protein
MCNNRDEQRRRLEMIRVLTAVLVICVLATPVAAEEANCMIDVTAAFEKALVAEDIKGIMALYADSDQIFAVESSGKVRRGTQGIRMMYEEAFAEADWTEANFELVRTDLGDNDGFCYFRFTARGKLREGTKEFVLTAQGTWLVRYAGDAWKIQHEHMSPLDSVPRLEMIETGHDETGEAAPEDAGKAE